MQEIKRKVDIVSVIGARVELKKAGRYYKGLCPFHGEKSPSFFVTPELASYKCFGCGESGDVYSFLQAYEGLSFREALEMLAEKAGVQLESYKPSDGEQESKVLYEILDLAKEYYRYLLTEHTVGQKARDYLKARKTSWSQVKEFELGWAPESWDGLTKYLVGKKGYKLEMVEKAGLVVPGRRGGGYDRFRGRVMFPLTDFRGRVVGFSGRLLDASAKEAKYVNTPETKLYRKRELLFGINVTRSAIRKKDRVILLEGEFDVISSVTAGVRNVVAIKGSAVTEEQVQLLMRLTKNLVLCLDADAAGEAATKRGVEVADKLGMDVSVVRVSGGKDVDELVRTTTGEWKKLAKTSVSVYQFWVESVFEKYDVNTGVGKKKISSELVPMLANISNSVEQAHYMKEVARKLEVGEEVLGAEIERYVRGKQLGVEVGERKKEVVEERQDRHGMLEKYIWSLLLQLPAEELVGVWGEMRELKMFNPGLSRLVEVLDREIDKKGKKFELGEFVRGLPPELSGLVEEIYLDEDVVEKRTQEEIVTEFGRVKQELSRLIKRAKLQELSEGIAKLEKLGELSEGDEAKLLTMQKEFAELSVAVAK